MTSTVVTMTTPDPTSRELRGTPEVVDPLHRLFRRSGSEKLVALVEGPSALGLLAGPVAHGVGVAAALGLAGALGLLAFAASASAVFAQVAWQDPFVVWLTATGALAPSPLTRVAGPVT